MQRVPRDVRTATEPVGPSTTGHKTSQVGFNIPASNLANYGRLYDVREARAPGETPKTVLVKRTVYDTDLWRKHDTDITRFGPTVHRTVP